MARKRIRNDQWKRVRDLLPGKATDSGRTAKDNRLFLEAVLWIARTGSPWRDLPPELGNWHATFTRFSRWRKKGVWQRVIEAISDDAELQALLLDRTAARSRHYAAEALKRKGPDQPPWSRSSLSAKIVRAGDAMRSWLGSDARKRM